MTNKEWLEEQKRNGDNYYDNEYIAYRQAKALEIIAEELIKLNENIDFFTHIGDKEARTIPRR